MSARLAGGLVGSLLAGTIVVGGAGAHSASDQGFIWNGTAVVATRVTLGDSGHQTVTLPVMRIQ